MSTTHVFQALPAEMAQMHDILSLGHFAFLNCFCLWTLHFLPADGDHWDTCSEEQLLILAHVHKLGWLPASDFVTGGSDRRQIVALSFYEILA